MNVTFVNELDACPEFCNFAEIRTNDLEFNAVGKGIANVAVMLYCEHAETCKYRQSSDGDAHAS